MTKTIERITEDGKRFYKGLGLKGESVTTLIGAFEDKSWMERWHLSLGRKHFAELGEEESDPELLIAAGKPYADEICLEASSHGTNQHEIAEFLLRDKAIAKSYSKAVNLPLSLRNFLIECIDPYQHDEFPDKIGCEVPIMFEKGGHCVGGTTDLICNFSTKNIYDYDTGDKLNIDNLLCVGDYKFPKKPKYNRDNVKYFIQLATYRAGIKFTYDVDIDNALLIVSPRSTETLYLWLFEKEVLDFYYETFLEMLFLYNHNLTHLFHWDEFVKKVIDEERFGRRIVHKNK
jgi:hypothetical protein